MSRARRAAGLLAGLVWLACGSGEPPNVLLVTLDTTRADHLGPYGYARGTSPHLDALAESATVFEDALATASLTPVSHASILTGQNPYRHGLRVLHGRERNRLPAQARSLAEILGERGYATGAFVSAYPVASPFGLEQGFDTFDEGFLKQDVSSVVSPEGAVYAGRNQRRSDATTDLALDWLARAPRPWLLWIHYWDPHDDQLLPPDELLAQFPALAELRGAERAALLYDIEIYQVDTQLGRVLRALGRRGELADTAIAVVSDHGESLGEHGWWTHGILYRAQIRAALILRAPGQTRGRRVEHLVRSIDVAPTLLEWAGAADAAADMQGASLAAWVRAAGPDPQLDAYADSVNAFWEHPERKDDLFMLRRGRWKYIHHRRAAESELYDLATDPDEARNRIDDHPERAAALRAALLARNPIPPPQPDATPHAAPDPEQAERAERLRALGYVE